MAGCLEQVHQCGAVCTSALFQANLRSRGFVMQRISQGACRCGMAIGLHVRARQPQHVLHQRHTHAVQFAQFASTTDCWACCTPGGHGDASTLHVDPCCRSQQLLRPQTAAPLLAICICCAHVRNVVRRGLTLLGATFGLSPPPPPPACAAPFFTHTLTEVENAVRPSDFDSDQNHKSDLILSVAASLCMWDAALFAARRWCMRSARTCGEPTGWDTKTRSEFP